MRLIVIIHKHHQFLASETRQIGISLLSIQIPKFKYDIIIVACTVARHAVQYVKEKENFIFSRALMGIVQHLKEFFKACALYNTHVILKFVFHLVPPDCIIEYLTKVLK